MIEGDNDEEYTILMRFMSKVRDKIWIVEPRG